MAITYPLTLPTSIGLTSISISPKNATVISRSPFTFQSQVQSYSGQMWGASVSISGIMRDAAEDWVSHLVAMKGHNGTMRLGDPMGATARGSIGGSPRLDGAHTSGSSSINIKDLTPSVTGWFKKGDWLQLGSGATARLHKCLNDVNSDETGKAIVDIWPNLRANYADSSRMFTSSTYGIFRLSSDFTYTIDNSNKYNISFNLEEAL